MKIVSLSCSAIVVIVTWVAPVSTDSNAISPLGKHDIIPSELRIGDHCRSSFECLLYLHHSYCEWDTRICTCQPYHIQYNETWCLPASLLGYGCAVDEQCTMKVRHSHCVNGLCECEPNHISLRKDKCLPPAQVDDYCLSDRQCHLSSNYSYCKYIIPRIYGKCQCPLGYFVTHDAKCLPHIGGDCFSDEDCDAVTPGAICRANGTRSVCACREGLRTSRNLMRCELDLKPEASEHVAPVSLGKPCTSAIQCKTRDLHSDCINGICECIDPSPRCSSSHRGCLNDTFQCRNGQCISWYYVCDGEPNCPDASDEDECVPFSCPKEAFQCKDGTCMSRGVVCNGRWECPDGSDEALCYTGIPCDVNAFRCSSGQCLPQYSFCNAVTDCLDGSDENYDFCERGDDCPPNQFRCGNNRCRSTAILCSGLDGCGDNTDEIDCEVCYCNKT